MLLDGEEDVVTSTTTETTDPVTTEVSEEQNQESNTVEENNPTPDRTFTRDEVTTIVKKRTERAINKILEKFGIENKDKIQDYLDSYNKSLQDLEELKGKYGALNREHLYLKNNILPEKYGDLDKEFTDGLTEEKLLEVLKNHPEFIKPKVVIPEKLGASAEGDRREMTEKEMAEKLFNVKL